MYWLGILQDLGKNYTDLYFNKDLQRLFLLVRLNEEDATPYDYALIAVSPEQIKEYMKGEKPIGELFSNQPYRRAVIKDKTVDIDDCEQISCPETFAYNLPFESELSCNKSNINIVVKRLMRGCAI